MMDLVISSYFSAIGIAIGRPAASLATKWRVRKENRACTVNIHVWRSVVDNTNKNSK